MAFNKNIKVTTAHLPKRYTWKIWVKLSIIVVSIIAIIFYMDDIGYFVGTMVREFMEGFGKANG